MSASWWTDEPAGRLDAHPLKKEWLTMPTETFRFMYTCERCGTEAHYESSTSMEEAINQGAADGWVTIFTKQQRGGGFIDHPTTPAIELCPTCYNSFLAWAGQDREVADSTVLDTVKDSLDAEDRLLDFTKKYHETNADILRGMRIAHEFTVVKRLTDEVRDLRRKFDDTDIEYIGEFQRDRYRDRLIREMTDPRHEASPELRAGLRVALAILEKPHRTPLPNEPGFEEQEVAREKFRHLNSTMEGKLFSRRRVEVLAGTEESMSHSPNGEVEPEPQEAQAEHIRVVEQQEQDRRERQGVYPDSKDLADQDAYEEVQDAYEEASRRYHAARRRYHEARRRYHFKEFEEEHAHVRRDED